MSFWSKLFRKKQVAPGEISRDNKETPAKQSIITSEYQGALSFLDAFSNLLATDSFISRRDYVPFLDDYKDVYTFFQNIIKGGTLSYYCKKNGYDQSIVEQFIRNYQDLSAYQKGAKSVHEHNENFLRSHLSSEKNYLDEILTKVDPQIHLDEEQRRVVLSDEDYTLVIAGAGAGKTTTVAAKVRYLVERKHVNPEQILVISFTNKAVGELQERINRGLGIPCPITTFHKAGYAILRKQEDDKKTIVDDGFLFNVINNYLKENILEQPEMVDKLILFFGSYFDAPYDGDDLNRFFNYIAKADFSTFKGNIGEYTQHVIDQRTGKAITINNEILRSAQEVRIANFLYMNQIEYAYEEPYQYHILKAKKPYTPDFCIRQGDRVAYIEHFGITQSGHHTFYSPEVLSKYKQEINDKITLHRRHNTTLLYTFSQYNDGRDYLDHLKEQLVEAGFELTPRSAKEVFEKIVNSEENRYILRFVRLVCTFITNFKTNGFALDDFYRFERQYSNVRTKLFLDVCQQCYLEYQKRLKERNAVDFEDMINDAARILREKQQMKERLDFKYIIVDEYQDISRQRFDLTKELSTICDAKIIAVGDDWQSIYAYAGSDISLFTHFCSIMGYGEELKITRTYRNAQEVINIAGNFIQKNDAQIKKSLISPKHIEMPVVIDTYSEETDRKKYEGKGGKFFLLGKSVEAVIGRILEANKAEGKSQNASILLIGRYGFDARNLCFSNDFVYDEKNNKIFSKKYRQVRLEFLTAHRSKGLGYDNVIIINARNELYGFPAKIDDDPVLRLVVKDDHSIEYAEERRLFYVAMTRTKNRVYIVTPEQHPSEFILELLNDYPNVTLNGNINRELKTNVGTIKKCPICGFPLLFRYKKSYGMRLWMCSNDPEVCSFITNDVNGGDLQIQKCDQCRDGYLVIKSGPSGFFLGCTNYKKDKTGCNRLMNRDYYLRWLTTAYERDTSVDMPSYVTPTPEVIPLPKATVSKRPPVERKKAEVHTTDTKEHYIEKDGFYIVVDDEGQILTDMQLLGILRNLRGRLMKEKGCSAYTIIGNKGLVSLATYKPTTEEEFVSLFGLGKTTFEKYGQLFINCIKDYLSK
ncbi:MAG: UvrD-helicase domain-containing protein [Clostridia bacterium]|nr:UvrD-helicase domain-containing protein [Clostridia bacterium]